MANILIIEDDISLAEDLKFFIKEEGHDCQIYTRADDVIDNINDLAQFDWIILDIMMLRGERIRDYMCNPDIETGEILYQKIRKKYRDKNILIISAKDFYDMSVDLRKERHVKLCQKPITEGKLQEILKIIGRKNDPN